MVLRKVSLGVNLLIAAIVLFAWARMAFHIDEHGALSASGLRSLKYFTVLSNLLQGVASAACAVFLARTLRADAAEMPRALLLLKYAGATSVALTFMTVVCFLGPVYGFGSMYRGANFWFHLIVPLLAALDFCALDRAGAVSLRDSYLAVAPMLLYGAWYVINLLVNGLEKNGRSNDWYGFARGGPAMAVVAFVVITLGTWGLALLLRLPRRG